MVITWLGSLAFLIRLHWGTISRPTRFNFSIGFWMDIDLDIVKACQEAKSNDPYWEYKHARPYCEDLRDPQYKKEFEKVKKQFGL